MWRHVFLSRPSPAVTVLGRLILVLVAVPFVELLVLLRLADAVGVPATIGLVVGTAVVGGALARSQGVQTLRRLQHRVASGESPSRELVDGALILVGAALLLTPGLLTDAAGFLLLLPVTRPPIRDHLRRRFDGARQSGWVTVEVVDDRPEGKG